MDIFSQNLKKLRNGRSQKEFASFLGISSQQTYANYEKGRIPKNNILQQIAQRCDVSIDWLLGREKENKASNTMDYKGAFEEIVKNMPRDELFKQLHILIDKAEKGNENAFLAAKNAFELIQANKENSSS